MADKPETAKLSTEEIAQQGEDLSAIVRDENSTTAERAEARKQLNELSQQAVANRKKAISEIKDEDERKIIQLYEQGVQTYAIAKKVYKFVNQDTVGTVALAIRKHYSDDFNEVEDVNSTKGYTGIGTS